MSDLVGHYMGRVRGIIKIDVTFNGDATVDTTIDVIGLAKIDCSAENLSGDFPRCSHRGRLCRL